MTHTKYPVKLDAVDMVEFTKGKSYRTGTDRHERPYVIIEVNGKPVSMYLWATYEQMYIREDI